MLILFLQISASVQCRLFCNTVVVPPVVQFYPNPTMLSLTCWLIGSGYSVRQCCMA